MSSREDFLGDGYYIDKLLHLVGWGFLIVSIAWLVRFIVGISAGHFYAVPLSLAIAASLLSTAAMAAAGGE